MFFYFLSNVSSMSNLNLEHAGGKVMFQLTGRRPLRPSLGLGTWSTLPNLTPPLQLKDR